MKYIFFTLIHADDKATKSIVIIKRKNSFQFANPGRLRISNYLSDKRIEKFDTLIAKDFSSEYNFKKLLLAKPHELRELKRLFNGDIKDYNIFKTYYGYLNRVLAKLGVETLVSFN